MNKRDFQCHLCFNNILVCLNDYTFDFQLKVGKSDDCIPRNGRWNFNNKVSLKLYAVLEKKCDIIRIYA